MLIIDVKKVERQANRELCGMRRGSHQRCLDEANLFSFLCSEDIDISKVSFIVIL